MPLRELLDYIEFDYKIIASPGDEYFKKGEKVIRLIDKTNVYLGTIRDFEVEASDVGVEAIIERLYTYWYDYFVSELEQSLEADGIKTNGLTWEQMSAIRGEHSYKEQLFYVNNSQYVVLDPEEKAKL